MKTGQTLQGLAAEIERRANAKRDLVAPTAKLHMVEAVYAPYGEEKQNIQPHLSVAGQESFSINGVAHDQIGTFTGIPSKYYDRMLKDAPALLCSNVNKWLHESNDKRMVRTLDGTARAFLSDKFRPLENEDLAEAVLPVILDLGLDVMSCEITNRRLYLKVVDPKVTREIAEIGGTWGDGKHKILRGYASPAVTISNSEVGMGALSVLGGVYQDWCTNLATFGERSVRKYHVGARHELASEEIYSLLSNEARAAQDKAVWHQIREVVKIAFDRARFDQLIDKVEGTQQDKIEGDPVQVVSLAAKRFGANEAEGKGILRHLIEGGSLTRFGLYNAITRTAQDLESYDRATEFEAIGGKIIELPKSEWNTLALAA